MSALSCDPAAMIKASAVAGVSAVWVLLSACGGEAPPPQPPPLTTAQQPTGPVSPSAGAVAPEKRQEAGHNLAMLASACWFGGLWGDASGDSPEMRAQASEARCHDVIRRTYGSDDKTRYEQLRAFEPSVVGDVAAKVEQLAPDDPDDAPRAKTLGAIVKAVAAAQNEAMLARRAAAKIRRDLAKEPDKLSDDEVAAVAPMKDTRMLEALLKFDAGDLTHDVHALGVMAALERMNISLDLPKHMKVYAVEGANQLMFAVAPPADVPEDATKRLPRGAWLKYITDVAKGAGHPVPNSLKEPKQREPIAWAGALDGYGDKLRADLDQLVKDTRLRHVVTVIADRLDVAYRAELNAYTGPPGTGKQAPAGKTPAGKGSAAPATDAPPPPKPAK